MTVIEIPSPNFSKIDGPPAWLGVVIHISTSTLSSLDNTVSNINSKVSSHYGIGRKGEIHHYVDEEHFQAWHAGVVTNPRWSQTVLGKILGKATNQSLLGIEHEGTVTDIWTPEQYASSSLVVKMLCNKYNIPIDSDHILPHSLINLLHSGCPGKNCDLARIIQGAKC